MLKYIYKTNILSYRGNEKRFIMEKKLFGTLKDGSEVFLYTLKNENTRVEIMSRGATIVKFISYGIDIVAGFDTLEGFVEDTASYQGALIGRVSNRVAGAKFVMDGKEYNLYKNNGDNSLHGGQCGFNTKNWALVSSGDNSITLAYTSPDGEEGYPSTLYTEVVYTLVNDSLIIEYYAKSDGKTPVSLTNHSYFNLDGISETILSHEAEIYADSITEVGSDLIPNGNHPKVEGTVFDFNKRRAIGAFVGDGFTGYDHNYMLTPKGTGSFNGMTLPLVAKFYGKTLEMDVYTDQPCAQFYTGNYLSDMTFKGGVPAIKHGAFCFETQVEPNSINNGKSFYDQTETYVHKSVYSIKKI